MQKLVCHINLKKQIWIETQVFVRFIQVSPFSLRNQSSETRRDKSSHFFAQRSFFTVFKLLHLCHKLFFLLKF